MKRLILSLAVVVAFAAIPVAQAGVIRSAGKSVASGTATVASAAANNSVTKGAVTVGKDTGGAVAAGAEAVGDGTVTVAKGTKSAPATVAHGTAKVAKKVWKFVW